MVLARGPAVALRSIYPEAKRQKLEKKARDLEVRMILEQQQQQQQQAGQ